MSRRTARADLDQILRRRRDQVLALAGPLFGQQGVFADDQPLAGEQLLAFDLRHVPLVEQRGLQRAVFGQGADPGGPEGEDPVVAVRLEILAHARLRDHAPVSDEHRPLQSEAVAELADLGGHGGGVGRVPWERLDGDRPSFGVAQQTELDLRQPFLAVARVSSINQRAGPAVAPDRGQIVKNGTSFAQVLLGQRLLDPRLALEQPVHGLVEPVLAQGLRQAELRRQGGDRRLRPEEPGGGELRSRLQNPLRDQRHRQIPRA